MRDYFKEKKALADPPQIEQEYQYGLQTLEMLKRQARAELFMMLLVVEFLTCSIFLSYRLS